MNIKPLAYPQSKKGDMIDTYFGTPVPDPYRWLEDDEAADTKAWVVEQNKVTQHYLDQIPYRESIRQRLENLWNYEKYSAPFKEGKYTYFYKNDGLQSQSVLYRQLDNGKPEVFLDANTFSADGTTSLGGVDFSKDGSLWIRLARCGGFKCRR
jgi:prolyl oligopeptidase